MSIGILDPDPEKRKEHVENMKKFYEKQELENYNWLMKYTNGAIEGQVKDIPDGRVPSNIKQPYCSTYFSRLYCKAKKEKRKGRWATKYVLCSCRAGDTGCYTGSTCEYLWFVFKPIPQKSLAQTEQMKGDDYW